jgi:perosamine synthetase
MRPCRTQPPVGYRFGLRKLARAVYDAARIADYRDGVLLRQLEQYFGVRNAFALSSGKAALTVILTALSRLTGRRRVIIPAYTCYSLPSSIVKARLEVVACDVAAGSFDYDYEQLRDMLDDDVLCVLSVHLFGIPSDTARLRDMCRLRNIFVVDDAAQGMGAAGRGKLLGTGGDVGFFSLGRGKNLTSGSGGIIVTDSAEIAAAVATAMGTVRDAGSVEEVRVLITLSALSLFISPWLYWIPAGLPFLRLGETIFYEDFPIQQLSNFQALLLKDWPSRLAALNAVRQANGAFYAENIRGARAAGPSIPYLRFPVVLPSAAARNRLLEDERARALGIIGLYPTTVAGIRQLEGRLARRTFPKASRLASSLVTLPTHPLVSDINRTTICQYINAAVTEPWPVEAHSVSLSVSAH